MAFFGLIGRRRQKRRRNERVEPRLTASMSGGKSSGKSAEAAPSRRRPSRRDQPRRPARRRRSVLRIVTWGATLCLWGFIVVIGATTYVYLNLDERGLFQMPEREPGMMLLSADGHVVAERGSFFGDEVRIGELPRYVPGPSSPSRTAASNTISASTRWAWCAPSWPIIRPAGGPGRLDHHPAAGEKPVPRARPYLRAQIPGGRPRAVAGEQVLQGRDPPALPQPHLFRRRRHRRGEGLAEVLRQVGPRHHAGGSRDPRRCAQRAFGPQPDQTPRTRRGARQAGDRRDGRDRRHHQSRGRAGDQRPHRHQARRLHPRHPVRRRLGRRAAPRPGRRAR
jgi:hypothetical protein